MPAESSVDAPFIHGGLNRAPRKWCQAPFPSRRNGAWHHFAGPFTLEGRLPGVPPGVSRVAAALLDGPLGLRELQRLYRSVPEAPGSFVERALDSLDLTVDVRWSATPIPRTGPLLVASNHPFGIADGLAVLSVLQRVRADVRVLANDLLAAVSELRNMVVPVNPFAAGCTANAAGLRIALDWLATGGCLVTFPAGEVAHDLAAPDLAVDGPWHGHVAALAVRTHASVVPVFISGANSRTFRAAGLVHPALRTALLPRELLRLRGTSVRVVIGEPFVSRSLDTLPRAERAAYLKARTYVLAHRLDPDAPTRDVPPRAARIVTPLPDALIARDVAALSPERRLASTGGIDVYCARAADLPHVLQEIGRLREETFRAAGEGTGRATDLDRFDESYWHLFAWDAARGRVVGAYRLGATDEIVPRRGAAGLYTNTLFRYDERLVEEIGPALELGRSFVREEYQRGFAPLLALWKGVGQFVVRNPRYRRLLGAVSISSRYDSFSRQLLVRFLSTAAAHPSAARLVRPRRPLPVRPADDRILAVASAASLESVSELVCAIERDGKPMPVLLRQYLNLNARLLAFSVDPDFGDAVDGLMLADLTDVPRPMLQRLMGRGGAERFLACHRAPTTMSAAAPWWRSWWEPRRVSVAEPGAV
jgi:putative hemolysin